MQSQAEPAHSSSSWTPALASQLLEFPRSSSSAAQASLLLGQWASHLPQHGGLEMWLWTLADVSQPGFPSGLPLPGASVCSLVVASSAPVITVYEVLALCPPVMRISKFPEAWSSGPGVNSERTVPPGAWPLS